MNINKSNASLITTNFVLFTAYGKQYRVESTSKALYNQVVALVKDNKIRACVTAINADRLISNKSNERVVVNDDQVVIDGVVFKGNAKSFARAFAKSKASGAPTAAISLFFENIAENKNQESITGIVNFISNNKIAITDRGTLLAYKKVRDNYFDIHSGTMLNKPGTTVSLKRDQVDFDASNECSSGLHFCGYDYLKEFGSNNNPVVVCEVNPKDVAAVPKDYNYRKARTTKYNVVCTLEAFREILNTSVQDAIGEQPVFVMSTLDNRNLYTGKVVK